MLDRVNYNETEKETLIDAMLAMIKTKLMKCDINDISIDREGYTYRINFKYKEGERIN